jgi:hypothetical protein
MKEWAAAGECGDLAGAMADIMLNEGLVEVLAPIRCP